MCGLGTYSVPSPDRVLGTQPRARQTVREIHKQITEHQRQKKARQGEAGRGEGMEVPDVVWASLNGGGGHGGLAEESQEGATEVEDGVGAW